MTKDEALRMALEALEIVTREMLALRDELAERGGRPTKGIHQLLWDSSHKVYTDTAIPAAEAIREVLAQPEQEPVAWMDANDDVFFTKNDGDKTGIAPIRPLYTFTQPSKPWVGLTEEERADCWNEQDDYPQFAAAIEAKLKNKNHG